MMYMKQIVLTFLATLCALGVYPQFTQDGYYRIRNVGSGRYITVTDNKGSVNVGATSADLGAVKLFKSFENVVSNPGTVLYVNEVNGLYRFDSQGTDTHKIIGYDLKLKKKSDGSYLAYQEESIMRMYLCDARKENTEEGVLSTRSDATNYRDWEIIPLSSASDNYFGVTSELTYNGAYYSTLYASFPFTFASSGMTAYYVSQVMDGIAVMKEVPNNVVPASVPVLIKAASAEATNNRLNIAANTATKPSDNKLGGVYFHNTSKAHNNLTPYNPETMRVLGMTSSGKLGFVKADIENLPANKAYLNVSAGTPDELELMTEAEYETYKNRTFDVVATAGKGGTVAGAGSYKVNTKATLTATPEEGYHFTGWSDGTVANPYSFSVTGAVSLTAQFAPNEYLITYVLDGDRYSTSFCLFGQALTALEAPTKEGYTFSGWSEIPATMPAHDVIVTGSFTVNSYTLTYMIDGQVYATESVEYGAPIVLLDAPVKDGFVFDGWTEAPATMPARDVVVTAHYTSGIGGIVTDHSLVDVYTLQGVRIKSQVSVENLADELPRGLYIVNGCKLLVK